MPYDILSDDLVDDGSNTPQRRRRNAQNRAPPRPFFLKPWFIHILLILILLGIIAIFISKTFDLGTTNKEVVREVTLAGDLKNFSKVYKGDLKLTSSQFTLNTSNGKFDDVSKDIKIDNFNGMIDLVNNSIVLSGTGNKIEYGKNSINLGGNKFKLISTKKTSVTLDFSKITLAFKNGNLKLDSTFNYDFENTNISFTDFNMTMSYDTTFTFVGTPKTFAINSPKDKLQIIYDDSK